MACASGHSGKSSGVVSNRLASLEAVGSLIGVGGGSGKGEIILLTPEGSGTEVLGESIPGSFLLPSYPLVPQNLSFHPHMSSLGSVRGQLLHV